MEKIEQKVMEIVESCLPKDGLVVSLEADIQRDLEFDSLDMTMLWNELEAEFGFEIQSEHLEGVRTVGDVIKSIEKLHGTVIQQ